MRMMIVEDEAAARKMLRMTLERLGHEVVAEAVDGRAALEAYRAQQPDLVLLDYLMPGMDGLALLRALLQEVPHARVVMLSGVGNMELVGDCLAAGALDWIRKGLPLETFRAHLDDVIQRHFPGHAG